jgi:D-alanyl-D-alanine carboxypeptidase
LISPLSFRHKAGGAEKANPFFVAGKMTRRVADALMVLFLAVFAGLCAPAARAAPHLVVDLKTGKVIAQEQAFDRWYPASLTKLMTVYVALAEAAKGSITLQSPVMISPNAANEAPSRIGLGQGAIVTLDAAIRILMVKSANDMATAIAESVAGSEQAFAGLMNSHAAALGMADSHFVNAHGLHHDDQYTTARDLAVLATRLRRDFPSAAHYFAISAIQVGGRTIANHNQLLLRFPGATGMKTGFTCPAGMNIVVTAKKGARELLAVVLGGTSGQERNVRAARLLTEGFATNTFFIPAKLDTLKEPAFADKTPTNMREQACKARPKRVKVAAKKPPVNALALFDDDDDDQNYGSAEVTLDELEEKYLGPRLTSLPAGRVQVVALGNATGPDPYGLVARGAELTAARLAAEAKAAKLRAARLAKAKAAKKAKLARKPTQKKSG